MVKPRDPLSVTFAVWQAIFLREALDRLFDMRAAWMWLLVEPLLHIGFIAFVWRAIRVNNVGGVDISVWVAVGMLAFFLFRRTGVQVMHAVDSNKPYFTYRQVKPFDTAIVRAGLEAFLMAIISLAILSAAALLGHETFPQDPLLVFLPLMGLWLFGLGFGLVASVMMALIPEMEHIFKIVMMPLYLISGVIMPVISLPPFYRDLLLINPLVHGLELVRVAFFPNYHAIPGLSAGYLYTWGGLSVFLGLLLYRRFSLQLVMR